MLPLTRRTGTLVTAMVLGTILFVLPPGATAVARDQPAPTPPPSAAAPTPPAAAQPAKPRRTRVDRVEAHIQALHDQMMITAAQEAQWTAVAQVMRDNAKSMSALVRDRAKKLKTMTAVDDLHSYETLAEAHAAGVKNLIPPFETLYASMSDAQKKNADAVFGRRPRHAPAKKSG
jgi:periplasmic protein CpxP/Spy